MRKFLIIGVVILLAILIYLRLNPELRQEKIINKVEYFAVILLYIFLILLIFSLSFLPFVIMLIAAIIATVALIWYLVTKQPKIVQGTNGNNLPQ